MSRRYRLNRQPRRVDANQPAVVDALRAFGATVRSLADIGKGCPDLLVGYRGRTILMEVKDGAQPPSKRRLTEDEESFFRAWTGGQLVIVESPEQAVEVLRGAIGAKERT